ncbi:MAG: NaeI family type II restriction endonuclease [Acidobacteriota bacterium]
MTYIGTKVEIRLRHLLGAPKGKRLDLLIDGVEVDVKNTIHKQWSIPPEAIDHPCILIRINEKTALCSLGILVVREHLLNQSKNRDDKKGISRAGLSQVKWILHDEPYPKNFWEEQDPVIQAAIKSPRGGTERLATLFRLVQRTPIPRSVVESVAQQKDPLKRLRRNGGARDILSKEGITLLWGRNHRDVIRRLGLPPCGSDEFISLKPSVEEHRLLDAALESLAESGAADVKADVKK